MQKFSETLWLCGWYGTIAYSSDEYYETWTIANSGIPTDEQIFRQVIAPENIKYYSKTVKPDIQFEKEKDDYIQKVDNLSGDLEVAIDSQLKAPSRYVIKEVNDGYMEVGKTVYIYTSFLGGESEVLVEKVEIVE